MDKLINLKTHGTPDNYLPANYKQCRCGNKLNKKTRFALVLQAPKHINTNKREKEGGMFWFDSVVYMCEVCARKIYDNQTSFIHYPDSYPM